MRTELAPELARLDAAISSRLATSGYTTPPTASAIALAVEQSILDEDDGQAILNAIVSVIGNQNIDEVALVTAIRADIERSDGLIATRLASSDYVAPSSAEDTAVAVRAELVNELARISNSATTQEVAEIVEEASKLPE